MKKTALLALAAGALSVSGYALAQDIVAGEVVKDLPKTQLQVVGGLNNLTAYQDFEKPFWSETVPKLSDGKVTATIKGFPEMGLKGPEIMRLISQGVVPIGTATLSYFASDNAINEAIDLPGVSPDVKTAHEVTKAFAPVYAKYYAKQNVKVLGFSTYPAQVLFCNATIHGLQDIKGKKVRTSSRTQAEFIQALGGTSVTLPFGEVVPALQNGVVNCAITGSMSGYSAKWYEVSTHLLALPINWNQQIHAANMAYWNKLNPKVQDFLQKNITAMTDKIWDDAGKATQEGYDCNSGAAACPLKDKGHMTLVQPSAADRALLKKLTADVIVPKWAARCSADCVQDFDDTIGKMLGIKAKK
ncbi:MAG TPA: TRAP transporter substrate-binding protein [Castellaniella sp.]|uniref:TRAP transporter substrate-binding protein n=1 Tax=Castellaniella sp. TaxID=1955812 RepID=UPI002EF29D67